MDVKLVWGGWNTDGTSDKVWGVIQRAPSTAPTPYGAKVYVFWGARGKSMQFKSDKYNDALSTLIRTKRRKGYKQIDYNELLRIWPDFEGTLSTRLTWHLLTTE